MNDQPTESGDALADLIAHLIRGGRVMEARIDDVCAPVGLSAIKMWALTWLAEADAPLPLGRLAERLQCAKSNATQLVDRLEADELVRRIPDLQDRRMVLVEITAEGRCRFHAGREAMRVVEGELASMYDGTARSELVHLLARLIASRE